MMLRRLGALALAGLFVAGLGGCGRFQDDDFVTRCAGHMYVRGFDTDATHEVVVDMNDTTYIAEAVAADEDVVKTLPVPSPDGLTLSFLLGTNLDDIDMTYCTDYLVPPPGLERTLQATSGEAVIVLHPADHERSVFADITLTDVTFSDATGTVKVESFVIENAHISLFS